MSGQVQAKQQSVLNDLFCNGFKVHKIKKQKPDKKDFKTEELDRQTIENEKKITSKHWKISEGTEHYKFKSWQVKNIGVKIAQSYLPKEALCKSRILCYRSMVCSSMVSIANFGPGDPGLNPGWFAVSNSNQTLSCY